MARKVFISILGTGYYNRTKYYWHDKDDFVETRFIQEATLTFLTQDWGGKDKVFLFLTAAAKEKNWLSPAQKDDPRVKNGERATYKGLEERIKELKLSYVYKEIPEGNDENQIWKIFQTVFDSLDEQDELYFDITHAFRSIPMLVMVLINYAKFLKKIKVSGITYGNWEGREKESNLAPIIDLSAFSELQDWTSAAGLFAQAGRVDGIRDLLERNGINAKGMDFTGDILTCRGLDILRGNKVQELKNNLKKLDTGIKPFKALKEKLLTELRPFGQNKPYNGFHAVQFCLNYGLVQQGITLLLESIVTFVMKDIGINEMDKIKSYRNRNLITVALQKEKIEDIDFEKFLTPNDCNCESSKAKKIKRYTHWCESVFALGYKNDLTRKVFLKLSKDIRNDINHAGFRTNPILAEKFNCLLHDIFNTTKRILGVN